MSDQITITKQYAEVMSLANMIAGVAYATGTESFDLHHVTTEKLMAFYPSLGRVALSEMALSIIPTFAQFYEHMGSFNDQEDLH